MNNRRKVLTAVLGLTLLASLTLACIPSLPGLGGGVTEEETPTPPPSEVRCGDGVCEGPENPQNCPQDCQPPEGETPPPSPEEELPFEMDLEGLNNLDSYAYALHLEGLSTATGAVEHMTLDIQGQRQNRPTKAEQLSFSSTDGQASSTEFVYIEDQNKMWARESGGQWQELPVEAKSMLDAFSMGTWWNTMFTAGPGSARLLGQEMVNGVLTNHYQITEAGAWGYAVGCTWASVQDDTWVAVDGSFPVKRQFDAAGECQGESGEVSFLMEIRNVNQPVSISPPM